MIKNFIDDIKIASNVFKTARQARKNGADAVKVTTEPLRKIPVITVGASFYDTVEGTVLSHCESEIVDYALEAFRALPPEERHRLSFSPEEGEFVKRANYWRDLLEPVLSPRQLSVAMQHILHWFVHIKKDMKIIKRPKNIGYPLYPDIPDDTIMSKTNIMHKALIDKVNDDLYSVYDYDKKGGSKVAHDFLHGPERGRLVNMNMHFYNPYVDVTYAEYKRAREELDICFQRIESENLIFEKGVVVL